MLLCVAHSVLPAALQQLQRDGEDGTIKRAFVGMRGRRSLGGWDQDLQDFNEEKRRAKSNAAFMGESQGNPII